MCVCVCVCIITLITIKNNRFHYDIFYTNFLTHLTYLTSPCPSPEKIPLKHSVPCVFVYVLTYILCMRQNV